MTLMAAAALIVAVLWTPALWQTTPDVELPAIVVEAPRPSAADRLQTRSVYEQLPERRPSFVINEADFWTGANALLFEYSSLYHRHRGAGLVRTGLD